MVALVFVQLQKGQRIWLNWLIPSLGGICLAWWHHVLKWGKNSTPKHHCPHVRSVSKCPKMSVTARIGKKPGKIKPRNALGTADLFLALEALCSAVISAIPNPIHPTHTQPVLPEINWIWGKSSHFGSPFPGEQVGAALQGCCDGSKAWRTPSLGALVTRLWFSVESFRICLVLFRFPRNVLI